MDLEEWDLLADEGFIDLHEDSKAINFTPKSTTPTTVVDMNYFQKFTESESKKMRGSRVIPVPIQLDDHQKYGETPDEVIKLPIDQASSKADDQMMIKGGDEEADFQEPVSQVFFKKLKENEFVDMKMDSPKSLNRGILPQIDLGSYQFEEIEKKTGNFEEIQEQEIYIKKEEKNDVNENDEAGLNVWKWAMTGIGALFSLGFAAVAVSVVVIGNRHKESCSSSKKQELHFQMYTHDKRFKQVVRHATKLNEAIIVMRGAPVTPAHITIGGYHEGL